MEQRNRREFKYQYTAPDFLRFLVSILGEKEVEASVVLWPNELFGELEKEREKFKHMDEKTLVEHLEEYQQFLSKMREKGIIPGWYLSFDNAVRQHDYPQIKKMSHHNRGEWGTFSDVSNVTLVNPENFLGSKWETVSFSEFLGEKSIQILKEAIPRFVERGYSIVRVYGGLNPQPWEHEYTGGVDYDGHLSAGGGIMTLSGNFPEDFDFRRFVPKKLPGSQKMLEQLARIE